MSTHDFQYNNQMRVRKWAFEQQCPPPTLENRMHPLMPFFEADYRRIFPAACRHRTDKFALLSPEDYADGTVSTAWALWQAARDGHPRVQAGAGATPITERLAQLLADAYESDQVVTVELQPLKPLAMGHYRMIGAVRPARHPRKEQQP